MLQLRQFLVLAAGLVIAAGVVAQEKSPFAVRFSAIESECSDLRVNVKRAGVLCTVGEHMGKAALFIQVVPREGEPGVDQARKTITTLRRNFYADGGTQLITRSVDKAGRTWERYCYRTARFPSGTCNDPVVVQPKG